MRTTAILLVVFAGAAICTAAKRQWQTGTWTDTSIKRQIVDFGPGASGFGQPNPARTMRAMADVRTYVIETDELRLELQDIVQINHRSVDVTVGRPVTFALDKNTVYVRDADGTEHKLRITKKVPKSKS